MDKCVLSMNDAVIINNEAWFFTTNFNGLYSADLKTKNIVFRGSVPWEGLHEEYLYMSIVENDGKIYLIPYHATCIAIYDIERGEFEKIEISQVASVKQFYVGGCFRENELWIFPALSSQILCIDIHSGKVSEVKAKHEHMEQYVLETNDIYFHKQVVCEDNKIYTPLCNANVIVEIDCATKQYICHLMKEIDQGFSGICKEREELWLIPRKDGGDVICWNPKTGIQKKIRGISDKNSKNYVGCEVRNETIYIYSVGNSNTIYESADVELVRGCHTFVRIEKSNHIAYSLNKNELVIYDEISKNENIIQIAVPYEQTPIRDAFFKKTVTETDAQMIDLLLEVITEKNSVMIEEKTLIGENIYNSII